MAGERKVYKVTELTRLIKSTLEQEIGDVWVEGELSNVRRPSSGHTYFTIKDASSQIGGALFRGNQRAIAFQPKDGVLVRAFGAITVYERHGNYQIIVRRMEEGGKGDLQRRFEELKEKLRLEGLFDESRKKPIPTLPQHVGVVTSPTGAAIRDILNVVARRFPNLHIVLAPVKVQGETAAREIAEAIDILDGRGGLDAMIVGRGGGSLEDLWCFNEEIVARAIARCGIPIISAVGHEIDFSISDLVADMRAPTPSAAAELVVERKDAFEALLEEWTRRLSVSVREALMTSRHRLLAAEKSYVFREPENLLTQYRQGLDSLEMRLCHEAQARLKEGRERLADCDLRIKHEAQMRHRLSAEGVRHFDIQLKALNPLAVLRRGYSLTSDESGNLVRSSRTLEVGRRVRTRVAEGEFESEVTDVGKAGEGKRRKI